MCRTHVSRTRAETRKRNACHSSHASVGGCKSVMDSPPFTGPSRGNKDCGGSPLSQRNTEGPSMSMAPARRLMRHTCPLPPQLHPLPHPRSPPLHRGAQSFVSPRPSSSQSSPAPKRALWCCPFPPPTPPHRPLPPPTVFHFGEILIAPRHVPAHVGDLGAMGNVVHAIVCALRVSRTLWTVRCTNRGEPRRKRVVQSRPARSASSNLVCPRPQGIRIDLHHCP